MAAARGARGAAPGGPHRRPLGPFAGVTGFLGNVLLVILFTTPADGPYAWTGPANDIAGVVSALAMIPVAAGLLTVCGNRPGWG